MNQDLYEKLLNASFRFVSYRPRSEKEIHDFLQKKLKAWKTAGQVTIEKVINRLREYEYVNDEKFASWWIAQRANFRPKGRRLLEMELRQKGISKEVVEAAFLDQNTGLEPYDELEAAKQAISGKIALWRRLAPPERARKAYGFLGRRGFSTSTIRRVVDECVSKGYNTGEEKESI